MVDPERQAEEFLRRLENFGKKTPAPARAARASPAGPRTEGTIYKYCICACARWETHYIVEWLDYYRELGFDHVFLYCNDDDPAELYVKLLPYVSGPAPFVTFQHHPHQGQQYEMYMHFVEHGLAATEWVAFLDIDEFLRLPPGATIGAFMGRFLPLVECVLFNWVFFGPNGHKIPPDGPVLEQFTQRELQLHPYTKYVARASAVAELDFSNRERVQGFWHEFGRMLDRMMVSANVLGEHMMAYYEGFPEKPSAFINEPARREKLLQTAVVHHYAFRSERAFTERAERGLKGNFAGQEAWREWTSRPNFAGLLEILNAVEDRSLAGFWQEIAKRAAEAGTDMPERFAMQAAVGPGQLAARRARPEQKYRFVLIACARWEADCIAEWIAYHRHIGFEHLYLYCNDDAPEELYAAVLPFVQGDAPFITFHHFVPLGQQKSMYLHYLRHYKDEAEWMMFLDIDEFLRLPRHDTIADFVADYGDADAIYFNWCFFGNNGFDERPPGSVLLNYVSRAAASHNVMTKMITRTTVVQLDRLGLGPMTDFWHYWNGLTDFAAIKAVNVLGRDMHGYYDNLDASRAYLNEPGVYEGMIATGIVNHYAHKSRQDFWRRAARGTAGVFENQQAYAKMFGTEQMSRLLERLNAVQDVFLRDLWAGVLAPGHAGKIVFAGDLPGVASGPAFWSGAAPAMLAAPEPPASPPPVHADGPEYFILDSQVEQIATAVAGGRKTIVVEPDAKVFYALTERFGTDIAAGRLVVENYLPAAQGDAIALFTPPNGEAGFFVGTIDWAQLVARHGAPGAVHVSSAIEGFPAPVRPS